VKNREGARHGARAGLLSADRRQGLSADGAAAARPHDRPTLQEKPMSPLSNAASVPTRILDLDGTAIAYRTVGPDEAPPLLLLNRFRGTMDHWDPQLIDRLARHRRVVMFDQPGFARSAGVPADSLQAYAATTVAVARKLSIEQFDLLGFSMGGTVGLQLLLDQPRCVRRAVIAGSGPGHVPDQPDADLPPREEVWRVATKPVNEDTDFLFLFFEPSASSQQAGRAYLARLAQRQDAFARQVQAPAWQAQLQSVLALQQPEGSLLPRLREIRQPVLVANGRRDIMVPTYASYAMAQALPQATLKVYPDAGHGFLFQYARQFADDVLQFLE
jgi:pimeloyl-ACP methyl ester carboxylesterase